MFMPGANGAFHRDCSEQTAREIDEEVKRLLDCAYSEAKEILRQHRDQLERVTMALLQRETLDAQAFNELLAGDGALETEPMVGSDRALPASALI